MFLAFREALIIFTFKLTINSQHFLQQFIMKYVADIAIPPIMAIMLAALKHIFT